MRGCFSGVILTLSAAAFAQTPGPQFEVASIRLAGALQDQVASGKLHVGMKVDGARVDIGSLSLAELIPIAYRVKRYQVSGPGWIGAQRFDILAKLPEGANKDQVPEMLQALLAERFKLAIHRESKDQAIYALVEGKGGAKLTPSTEEAAEPASKPGQETGAIQVKPEGRGAVINGGQNGPVKIAMGQNGTMHFEMQKMTLASLAEFLSRFVERPVVDMTGLKGNYQVALDLSMDDLRTVARSAGVMIPGPGAEPGKAPSPAEAASDPGGGSIFTAVQQLGLKLEARKAPVETIVVDHVEKSPTEN